MNQTKKKEILSNVGSLTKHLPLPGLFKQIGCANDIAEYVKEIWTEEMYHESMFVIYLNQRNRPVHYQLISNGGVSATIVDTRIIMMYAAQTLASGMIMVHNHPSGYLKPSHEDEKVTKRVDELGKLLGTKLLDHLIIDEDFNYYSFANEDNIL